MANDNRSRGHARKWNRGAARTPGNDVSRWSKQRSLIQLRLAISVPNVCGGEGEAPSEPTTHASDSSAESELCRDRAGILVDKHWRIRMKTYLLLPFLLTISSAFGADAMKFVSPDQSITLIVDKSGRRDIIELRSGKKVHRLFYEDLDSVFRPKIAEAFNASLDKVGKVVLPTFTSARWISADEVEIKGESVVIINDDKGDEFTFSASVSKSGDVKHLTVTSKK
jgi:hypothetical protein